MRAAAAVPAVGVLAGSFLGLIAPDVPPAVSSPVLALCAVAGVWAWRRSRAVALVWIVGAGFAVGGAMLAQRAWQDAWRPSLWTAFEALAREQRDQATLEGRRLPEDPEAFAVLEGLLKSDAAVTDAGAAMSLEVGRIGQVGQVGREVTGGVAATVIGSLAAERVGAWRAGRRVRVPMTLHRAARYLDPGVPDHERALARRGITLVGTVKSGALVEVIARGSLVDETASRVRASARAAISRTVGPFSPRSAAIVAAIVIGDRVGLDEDVQRGLQEAGTYHVIAISGGNIAIFAGLILGAFRVAGLLGRTAMFGAIVILAAYAVLVGGGASVDRATLMAVVFFGGRALDHRSPPSNALGLVTALLVAADPLSVFEPAFVLTCGATLALLTVAPVVPTAGKSWLAGWALAMGMASTAAEAMLFPMSALIFSRVTFAGLALNFLAIPLMGLAQIAGMAVVPLALVSDRVAAPAGFVAHVGAAGLVASASLVRFAPMLTCRVAPPAWWTLALYYTGAPIAWLLWRRRRTTTGSAESRASRRLRLAGLAVAVAAGIWIVVEPWTPLAHDRGRLRVTFVDVGQGDAALVQFASGATLLVDAGGLAAGTGFDIGDRVVAPVLRDAGIRRLDYLALTHGDPDHIGGAPSVMREFRPRQVLEGIPVPPFPPLHALRDEAVGLGVQWTNVTAGMQLRVGEADVRVLHPPPADWERQRVRNDDSVVVDVRWRDVSVMLTGDIGKAVERGLVSTLAPAGLRVVKIPHHGSLTSSSEEFVRALKPRVAVVSAGRANHFGHPAPEVLDRYRAAGADVFRTDRDGAVTIDSDGRSVEVKTFMGRTVAIR